MKKICLLLLLFVNLFAMPGKSQGICPTGKVLYVNAAATGANNGSSWTDAYITLQDALANDCPGVQFIWVAIGTYYPDEGGNKSNNDRNAAFAMKDNIGIVGGFSGTETSPDQRNPYAGSTYLSGDIDKNGILDDGNSYHVIFNNNNGLGAGAWMDRCVITGGNANGSGSAGNGGGLCNINCFPAFYGCVFEKNSATAGGGVFNSGSQVQFQGCLIKENNASVDGGGMYNTSTANVIIKLCEFDDNTAQYGAGMYNVNCTPAITETYFVRNKAVTGGGGMFNRNNANPTISLCEFTNNTAQTGAGVYNWNNCTPSFTESKFRGNQAANEGGGMLNIDNVNANISLCEFNNNTSQYGAGLYNRNCTPTVTETKFAGNQAASYGGGIFNTDNANANISQCEFINNTGNGGGGVYNSNCTPTITGTKFTGNQAASYGGGIFNTDNANANISQCELTNNTGERGAGLFNSNCSPIISESRFTGNQAVNEGGAMFNISNANAIINKCEFTNNTGKSGAGVFNWNCTPTYTQSKFTGNQAASEGGGMLNYDHANATINNCEFTNNSSPSGGGVLNNNSSTAFINCKFAGNQASMEGGAMHNRDNAVTNIINGSFANNSATSMGGGIRNKSSVSTLTNCIVWGNNNGQIADDASSQTTVSYSIVEGGFTGTANYDVDPKFVNAATGDLHLQPGSPAINIGDNGAYTLATDLDGNTRIVGGTIDMGAYESQVICPAANILYVNAAAAAGGNGNSWASAYNSLQDALANACPDLSQIWVAKGTYSPDKGVGIQPGDRNAAFAMKPGLAIYGGFVGIENPNYNLADRDFAANASILSGDLLQNDATGLTGRNLMADLTRRDNSYHVVYNNNNPGAPAKLDGFTITGGNANNFSGINSNGGGMYNNSSSPAIINCSFTNNSASNTGGGMYNNSSSPAITSCSLTNNYADFFGGGMANNASSPNITSCSFASNSAITEGGALYNINLSSPAITSCNFTGNSAKRGGGMYNEVSSPEVINSSFAGNSAEAAGGGGGIYNKSSSPTITKCSFTSNAIAGSGAGIYNSASSPAITECSFAGNSASRGAGIFNDGASTPAISICKFTDNSAGTGGGIYNLESRPAISNCSFVNNSAGGEGGGMFNLSSNSSITNCSFFNNHASNGGGISNVNSSPTVTNCSFAKNSANAGGGIYVSAYSSVISNSIFWGNIGGQVNINPIGGAAIVSSSIVEGGYAGTGILALDPLFVDITAGDLHLQACSPAIDAGTATGAPDTDLDGNARPALDGYDMGAYEFTGTLPTALVLNCPVAAKVFACGLPGITTTTKLAYSISATNITEAEFVTAGGSISGTCGVSGISYQDAMDVDNSITGKTLVNRTFTVSDIGGKTYTCTQVITVQDYTIDASASSKPVAVGTTATLSATVSPAEKGVPVDFYIDAVFKGTGYTDGLGIATLDVTGLAIDVYQVRATIGDCVEGNAIFSVYNPDGGFVTGAGWINSPKAALVASPLITGKANFGLNAKYQKGKNTVDGDTEFKFKAGDFNFKSLNNDAGSLVISGGKATYRGTGTVNDAGDYGFMVVAIDGAVNGTDPTDKFRIKIWDRSQGNTVVYDNQLGKSEFGDDATELGGGAIVIQTPKVKKATITLQPAATNNDADLAIQVSNNPSAQGQSFRLQVTSTDKTTPVAVTVLDVSGRPVQSWKNQQAGTVLEAGTQWRKGIYIVEAVQDNKRVQVKLLKL